MFDKLLMFITSFFDVIIQFVMGGCQFIGSIILFMVLFIIFILMGFTVIVVLSEYARKSTTTITKWNKDDLDDYIEEQNGEHNDN